MTAPSNETPGVQSTEKPSRVTSNVDWHANGTQHAYLGVPYSADESAWGAVRIPITVLRNGAGPTVLFTGGNHGDEFEGPIALKKLAVELDPTTFRGTAVIIPCLNPPAIQANARCSPLDGMNMNRAFPGRRTGSVTEMICHYVATVLLPKADAVVDIHSGGRTLSFVPFAAMHYLDDPSHYEQTRAMLEAFDAPVSLIIEELDTEGMLDGIVEDARKPFIFTELAGGGTATPETVQVAEDGVRNVLHHFGILVGEPVLREQRGLSPSRKMATPDRSAYTIADETGLFECLVDLDEWVEEGQLIGRIHSIEKTGLMPGLYYAHRSGTLTGRHFPGLARPGDCLAVIGTQIEGLG